MTKDEFKATFKSLIDNLRAAADWPDKMPYSFYDLAKTFSRTKDTIEKWYNGASAPANIVRNNIIERLYAEQKKIEFTNAVRDAIKNDLRINLDIDSYTPAGSAVGFEITLTLGDKVISTSHASLNIGFN